MSVLDLELEIQQQLESNVMLERTDLNADSNSDTNSTQATPGVKSSSGTDSRPEIADNRAVSLFEHLAEQLNLEFISSEQRLIYEFLIDALNVDGLLMESLDEIKQSLSVYISDLQLSDIKVSLKKLQSCEPAGIAATTLTECLQLQLERIKQRQGSVDKLDNALQLIRSLNPRPGAAFAQTENTHIVPDVVVKRHRDQWVLEINQQRLPKVHVNKEYAKHIRGTKNDDLKQQLQDARFLINGRKNWMYMNPPFQESYLINICKRPEVLFHYAFSFRLKSPPIAVSRILPLPSKVRLHVVRLLNTAKRLVFQARVNVVKNNWRKSYAIKSNWPPC